MAVPFPLLMPQPLNLPQAQARSAPESSDSDDIYIAVMGVTGSGKSRFISQCTGQNAKIGHSLESCTTEVDDYSFTWRDKEIHLIDTPGFDDTHRSDREVLEDIASWLATSYEQNIKLSGILYLHRIIDPKVGGTSLRNLIMFKKLCGDDFYPRVFLVTTMWDKVAKEEAVRRESELIGKNHFWGKMISGGATVERHWGSRDSAIDILGEVIRNGQGVRTIALKVQTELIDEHKRLDETTAGRQFEEELRKQREKHEKEIKAMQEEVKMLLEMNEKKAAEETEKQRRLFEEKIARSIEDQAKLKTSLDEIQRRQAAEVLQLQEQNRMYLAAYQEKVRLLNEERVQLSRMDSTSSAAQNLQSKIAQDEADILQHQQELKQQEATIGKKIKKYYMKSADWVKQHPRVLGTVVKTGIRCALIAIQ